MATLPPTAMTGTTRRSTRARAAFRPRTVLAVLLVGSLGFLLMLYALGKGWTGQEDRDGGAHAASNSLNGYSALAGLLERRGHDVALSRSEAAFNDEALLVLTPSMFGDGEDIREVLQDRRWTGPTLLIVPKWNTIPVGSDTPKIEAEDGWVVLAGASTPGWTREMTDRSVEPSVRTGRTNGWKGLGLSGDLPATTSAQALLNSEAAGFLPIVTDSEDDVLAGVLNDNGYYFDLYEAADIQFTGEETQAQDEDAWPVVVAFEPDLLNNYALADETRARLAVALVEASMDGGELPIVFDLTMPGLGASENLLTLAFTPPFLAATLCLILLGFIIAWRAFRRFGAARAPQPAMSRGKMQLARNGARLVERAKRWHLLGEPYAAMVAGRIAKQLGIRSHEGAEREAAIDHALEREGHAPAFSGTAAALREAQRPADIIRAARALKDIERTLTR